MHMLAIHHYTMKKEIVKICLEIWYSKPGRPMQKEKKACP